MGSDIKSLRTYLEFIGNVNKHDLAWLLFSASGVETDSSDHINPTALNEIVHGSNFEDLDSTDDSRLDNTQLVCQSLHDLSTWDRQWMDQKQ